MQTIDSENKMINYINNIIAHCLFIETFRFLLKIIKLYTQSFQKNYKLNFLDVFEIQNDYI